MPRVVPLGESGVPRHVIAHLSDPHLLPAGLRQYGRVDPEAGLDAMLRRLCDLPRPPQALVFTGDLADRGDAASYRRLRALVEPVAADLGARVVWVMGNHDERAPYARLLLDDDGHDPARPLDRVHLVDGLRIVVLDTTVPGYHHGALDRAQLDWLAGVLATPAEHGTLLAMHHPPVPSPLVEVAELIALQDQARLAPVVAGTDVRGILGGHLHYSTYATFAGVPVSVASASCYTTDPAPAGRLISGVDGHQAFTMMHLYEDRVVHSIVPVAAAPEVSGADLALRELIDAMSPAERRETFSRKDSDFNRDWDQHEEQPHAAGASSRHDPAPSPTMPP